MKIDRSLFPPLTREDYLCEYYLTPATYQEFLAWMNVPPHKRPGMLRIKSYAPRRSNAKRKKPGAERDETE